MSQWQNIQTPVGQEVLRDRLYNARKQGILKKSSAIELHMPSLPWGLLIIFRSLSTF